MSRTHAPSGWVYRTHDPEELHEQLWGWVQGGENRVAWDIGANEGQSVDKMLSIGFTRVIALEPAIESFRILSKEWGGRSEATLLNQAAGAHDGEMELSVRSVPMGGGQLIAPGMPEEGWHGAELYRRKVKCVTLDHLLDLYGQPSLVKVDTEGCEVAVLEGASRVLEYRPDWIIEFHSHELMQRCHGMMEPGYIMQVISSGEESVNGWLLAEGKR